MNHQNPESSREKILAAVRINNKRAAVVTSAYTPGELYITPSDMLLVFKQEVEAVSGRCVLCKSETLLYEQLNAFINEAGLSYVGCPDDILISKLAAHAVPVRSASEFLLDMPAVVTGCEVMVARTGSVVMSSTSAIGRQSYAFAPIHIVIAHESQLVPFLEDALVFLRKKYANNLPSAMTFVTGPSRTADIEKTLVLGAHGPKELIIFVLASEAENPNESSAP
jgi:L-lactate dehydrogenase complex protein LldG